MVAALSTSSTSSIAAPVLDIAPRSTEIINPWLLSWLKGAGFSRWVLANLVVAGLYALLGTVVGTFFGAYGLFPAPIWLPSGIACIACMVGGAGLLPGIFLGSLAVNALVFESALPVAAMISASNALGPWVGMQVTRAMRPPSGLFTRFSGVLGFILGGVLLHATCTAAGGTLALALAQPMSLAEAYRTFWAWWLCDSGGTFFFAPALLLWLGAERTDAAETGPPATLDRSTLLDRPILLDRPTLLDRLVLAGMLATAVALFTVPGLGRMVRPDVVFLLTVPLSWITLRISLRAAYTLLTLICIIATVGTVLGEGPFHDQNVANPLQSVGLMTVLFAMDALTLIALTSERREAEARLTETRGTLARSVARTEHLTRETLTDSLTGAGNRRHFGSAGGAAIFHARRADAPLGLILFTFDHYRPLRENAGPATADAALRAVALACEGILRGTDRLFRVGGEEFAVLLPGVALAGALDIAERLRLAIGAMAMPGEAPLGASFGVTERDPRDRSIEELRRRADAAVCAAKAKGRNRIEAETAT
ncbi:MAG: Diguanylate cyclase protein [Belnapia sp.]|nr:Diguanylate cyclase protein [Belnapia sp.]